VRRPQATHLSAAHLCGRARARDPPGPRPPQGAPPLLAAPRAASARRQAAPAPHPAQGPGPSLPGAATGRPAAARAPLHRILWARHGHAEVGVRERGAHRDHHELRGHVVLEERLVVRASQQVGVRPRLRAAQGGGSWPRRPDSSPRFKRLHLMSELCWSELPGRHKVWHAVVRPAGCSTDRPHGRRMAAQGRPAREGVNGWHLAGAAVGVVLDAGPDGRGRARRRQAAALRHHQRGDGVVVHPLVAAARQAL